MEQRIQYIIIALMAIVGSANAQTLSVQPIEAQPGEQTEVVVSLTGGTAMTALQFNLQLPEGVTVDANSATLGAATDGHTLSVQTLDGGDLLFIIYSMDLKAFKDGELIRIPVTAGNAATTATAQLYTVRTATAEAVSHACADADFNITVKATEQPAEVTDEQYAAATEAIAADQQFYVCTTSNGTTEGTQRYYLTADGYLTAELLLTATSTTTAP